MHAPPRWEGASSSEAHRSLAAAVQTSARLAALCGLEEAAAAAAGPALAAARGGDLSRLGAADQEAALGGLGLRPQPDAALAPATRPIRLFNVSHAKRNVGAMFCEVMPWGDGKRCPPPLV